MTEGVQANGGLSLGSAGTSRLQSVAPISLDLLECSHFIFGRSMPIWTRSDGVLRIYFRGSTLNLATKSSFCLHDKTEEGMKRTLEREPVEASDLFLVRRLLKIKFNSVLIKKASSGHSVGK